MGIDAGAVAGTPAEVPVEGSGRARGSVLLAVVAVVVALDWSSKILASTSLDDGPVAVGSVLTLRLGHNPGIAFGLGDRLPDVALLLVTLAVTALLAVAALRGAFPSAPAAGLILGGAVGNLVDRAIGASVVDFIDLGWWPSFNVADVALTVGCAWLFVASFRDAPSTALH